MDLQKDELFSREYNIEHSSGLGLVGLTLLERTGLLDVSCLEAEEGFMYVRII